ncbi:MAG: DmsC/YnfH family molybdoenzyme membrane anchor subunit [Anaerolineae bacterium]
MAIEYSLLIFTLFSGFAIGSTSLAAVAELVDFTQKSERFKEVSKWGAYLALPCLIIGLAASVFHLGRPLAFLNGLSNLGSSWISREGVFGILFLILVAIYALFWFLAGRGGAVSKVWRLVVGILSTLSALALVFSTGMAYAMVRAIPAWNTPLTILFFAVSAFLLGTLLVGTTLAVRSLRAKSVEEKAILLASLQPFAGVGTILVITVMVVGGLRLVHLSVATTQAAGQSLSLVTSSLLGLTLARVIIGMVLPLVAMAYAWSKVRSRPETINTWMIVSFVCVLAGEVMARALFFLTAVHV